MKKIYLNAQTQVVELEMDNAIMLYSKAETQQELTPDPEGFDGDAS